MGEVIAVVSGKGGTGKTSFTAMLGSALAKLGYRTLCIDCDVGLRNLDLALGLSDRALMDFTDVARGDVSLEQAVVSHPACPRLYFLTAPIMPQRLDGLEISDMQAMLRQVRESYDYCLIDAGAGLGESFTFSTCDADRIIVIATTDATSLRDAQRTVMELRHFPTGRLHLVINRVRLRLLKSLHANLDDAIDAAGLPLLGVIPEDEKIPGALGRNTLASALHRSPARTACRNIARRITGERVPLMKLPKR